jgi:hypothetical protein
VELATLMWELGSLPAAMAGAGELGLGPQPWVILPLGKLQIFWTPGLSVPGARVRLLEGPWFLWLDLPPPRVSLGRAPGYVLVAISRGPYGPELAWELTPAPWLSVLGALGVRPWCAVRARLGAAWAQLTVFRGEGELGCGFTLPGP